MEHCAVARRGTGQPGLTRGEPDALRGEPDALRGAEDSCVLGIWGDEDAVSTRESKTRMQG